MANATVALRLGSLALNLQDEMEIKLLVDLMLAIWKCLEGTIDGDGGKMFIGGIATALGCIFHGRPTCSARQLKELGGSILLENHPRREGGKDESNGMHLMDIIAYSFDSGDFQSLMDILSASISDMELASTSINCWRRRPLPLSDQCSGLLISLSLLHVSITSRTIMEPNRALNFLGSFLRCYPRWASRAAPSVIDVAGACLAMPAPTTQLLLASLEFLASPCIVSDPHAAHLMWTFFSLMVQEGAPAAVRSVVIRLRSVVIRLLPAMCSSNKRLFRRARDVIGKSMVAQDPIIRSSATAALADLANLDLLRDVEQILGWVQNRLNDDEPVVVYYALEVLRYLVVNEELEFDLVVRVLEKRLNVDITIVGEVLGLDALALEGLVAIMGAWEKVD